MAVTNPWNGENLNDFLFYCCPKCDFKQEHKSEFMDHLVTKHPDTSGLVQNAKVDEQHLYPDVKIEPVEDPAQSDVDPDHVRGSFDYKPYLHYLPPDIDKRECKICLKEHAFGDMKNHIEKRHLEIIKNYFLCHVQYTDDEQVDEYTNEDDLWYDDWSFQNVKSKFKCDHCDKVFLSQKVLYNHLKKKHPEVPESLGPLKVDNEDDLYYKNEPKFDFDMSVKEDPDDDHDTKVDLDFKDKKPVKKLKPKMVDGKLLCEEHNLLFDTRHKWDHHKYLYHFDSIKRRSKLPLKHPTKLKLDQPETCHICHITFQDYNLFKVHMKQFHMKEGKYVCPECPMETKPCNYGFEAFLDHLFQEHGIGLEPIRQCEKCHEIFDSNMKYIDHKSRKHKSHQVKKQQTSPTIHVCEVCGKNFQTRGGLVNHISAAHTEKVIAKEDYVKTCPKCHQEFDQAEALDSHLKGCLGDPKDFRCKFCESIWISHLSLELHILVKHGQLKKACDECGNLFDSPEKVENHKKKLHLKVYECVCHLCAKRCATKYRLKQHLLRRHNIGERKYFCDQCDEKFINKHELNEHFEKTHDTENVYQCEECPKIFQVKSYLNTHIRNVHKKHRPHQCDICLEKFLYERDVIRHKKFHHKLQ